MMDPFRFDYLCRHALGHADSQAAPDLWDKLLVWIEQKAFLARQAEHFGDFEQTGKDLERHLLPELIRRGDWERFLRFSLVAANLRGLSDDLDEPAILRGLARAGRLPLAEKLVSQLAEPARRARAQAELVATQPASSEAFGRLIDALRSDIDANLLRAPERLAPEVSKAWCDALVVIAGCVGPELRARWPRWIASLDGRGGGMAERAWRALAESFLGRGEHAAEELWEALRACRHASTLSAFLPPCLAGNPPADPWPVLRRLCDLGPAGGRDLAWRAAVALLGVWAPPGTNLEDGPAVAESWDRAVVELGLPPWSEPLVETGRRLWRRLPESWFGACFRAIEDPAARAALAVVRLEEHPTAGASSQALIAIEGVSTAVPRLHWTLRYLLARPREPRRELEAQVASVVRYLARERGRVPAEDLCRFVDLVAEVFPRDLRPQLENILWTPRGDAEVLRTLARTSGERAVIDELFGRTEDYAAMAGATAAEGFELRREVLVSLAGRLCAADRELSPLDQAAERLLPEEEDELRREVALRLAEAGERELALVAAAGLRSRKLALVTRLALDPEECPLNLSDLYYAVAASPAIADERRALSALEPLPSDPAVLARDHLEGMARKGRQIEALVDLARHALAFQQRRFGRRFQDRLAAILPLKEALGVVESDAWLAALVPELVAVGARLGAAQAVAEVQEAVERILDLSTVAWPRRREALLRVIAGIENALSDEGAPLSPSRRRRALGLVEWVGRWPSGPAEDDGQAELRRDWHRILPWLRVIEAHLGVMPGRGLRRLWDGWGWLTSEQRVVADLSFLPQSALWESVDSLGGPPTVDVVRAMACSVLSGVSERVPELVFLLPPGKDRDELVEELIRFASAGSLGSRVEAQLIAGVTSKSRPRVTAWLWLRQVGATTGPVWPGPLVDLAAAAALDLDDPTTASWRRGIWRAARDVSLPALATAAVTALATGGKPGCEQGLRLFLNAYLAPVLGEQGGANARLRIAGVETAEESSQQLSPTPSSASISRHRTAGLSGSAATTECPAGRADGRAG